MIIDIVVGAVVLISAIISFLRGFIREVLTIAGVVAGFFTAVFFGPKLSPTFDKWLDVNEDPEKIEKLFDIIPMNIVADVCAYAAIFIAVVIIVSVISHFTASAAKVLGLGPIDRTLGVIFGIVRAIILLSLLYLPFHLLMEQESKTEFFANSKTHYYIEKTSAYIATFLPSSDDVKDKANDASVNTIKQKLLENDFLEDKKNKSENKPTETKPETGYKEEQRDQLENLFEKPALDE